MLETILGTIAIVSVTMLIAIRKVKKDKNILCNYNCENCGEQDVCCIKKEGKNERNL
ncbi:hypothetical protein HYI06_10485 [Clostridium botulinum]|uniref:hypothetical protein n=1 Tax=Clostridium TaxID=1485 RepID=UPI000AAF2456|nr:MULTISPECIES: hypothetical protein [Clostridium]MBY7004540.1 hypothetical protein [Clostridium botulinum]MCC5416475.1 hypothetical protein [Clostridium botulinum]MCR1147205.1 hypothetical protein [Clostridium botulinum]